MLTTKAIQSNLSEAQRIASGSGSEEDIAEAKIQIEVLEALAAVRSTSIVISTDWLRLSSHKYSLSLFRR